MKTAEERARAIVDDLLARGIPVGPSWTECIGGIIAGALREHEADVRADETKKIVEILRAHRSSVDCLSSFTTWENYEVVDLLDDIIKQIDRSST